MQINRSPPGKLSWRAVCPPPSWRIGSGHCAGVPSVVVFVIARIWMAPNPAKVIAFIDVFGDWDPSLAFVMAAAIPIAAVGFGIGARRAAPLCDDRFSPPVQATVDGSLIL